MDKKLKIILISAAAISVLGVVYFGIKFYMLQAAYNTTLNPTDANTLLQNSTSNVIDGDIQPDATVDNADGGKGTDGSGTGVNPNTATDTTPGSISTDAAIIQAQLANAVTGN